MKMGHIQKKIIASQQFSLKTKYRGITAMGPGGELISNIIFIATTALPAFQPRGISHVPPPPQKKKALTFLQNLKCTCGTSSGYEAPGVVHAVLMLSWRTIKCCCCNPEADLSHVEETKGRRMWFSWR